MFPSWKKGVWWPSHCHGVSINLLHILSYQSEGLKLKKKNTDSILHEQTFIQWQYLPVCLVFYTGWGLVYWDGLLGLHRMSFSVGGPQGLLKKGPHPLYNLLWHLIVSICLRKRPWWRPQKRLLHDTGLKNEIIFNSAMTSCTLPLSCTKEVVHNKLVIFQKPWRMVLVLINCLGHTGNFNWQKYSSQEPSMSLKNPLIV